jgi:ribose 5-phosphate isomerase B
MKIYLAGDHAGFRLKSALLEHLPVLGYDVEDLGPLTLDPEDDYPDYVNPLAARIAAESGAFGIILAGSGQGEAMAANRVKGVRCAVFYGKMTAVETLDAEGGHAQDGFDAVRLARKHNNANVLSIGARFVSPEDADAAIRIFLDTAFDASSPRHERRLNKF